MIIEGIISTGFPGAKRKFSLEVDDEELIDVEESERDKYLSELVDEYVLQSGMIEIEWKIKEAQK